MKKRKTNKLIIVLLIVIFSIIIISGVLYLIYSLSGNYTKIEYVDNSYLNTDKDDVKDSNIIIINNIVLGAYKGNKWISGLNYYNLGDNKSDIEVDMFSENKLLGTFKTASLKRYNNSVIYTTIARNGMPEKYLALSSSNEFRIIPGMTKIDATKDDEKYVKEAIGSYKMLNGSVNISEVYLTNINQTTDKIICATSKNSNMLGVYSAVIYVTENIPHIIKYAHVRNTKNADLWPVYSLQFVMDINKDSKPEIILQETTGKTTSYEVLELREDYNFYEVLKTTLEI